MHTSSSQPFDLARGRQATAKRSRWLEVGRRYEVTHFLACCKAEVGFAWCFYSCCIPGAKACIPITSSHDKVRLLLSTSTSSRTYLNIARPTTVLETRNTSKREIKRHHHAWRLCCSGHLGDYLPYVSCAAEQMKGCSGWGIGQANVRFSTI